MKPEAPDARSRRRRRRRRLLAFMLFAAPLLLWSCFPGPVRELWPPRPGEPQRVVDVLFWDWHTFIIEPVAAPAAGDGRNSQPAGAALPGGENIEWGFCETAWYLEGQQGATGVCRALLWPSASGVERKEFSQPYGLRHPQRDFQRWTFVLSDEGLDAMRAYLEAERAEPLPKHPGWYAGRSSYCLFFNCHHFTASALRAAGLPIRPWWAFSGWMTKIQLDRIQRFHEEEGVRVSDSRRAAGREP